QGNAVRIANLQAATHTGLGAGLGPSLVSSRTPPRAPHLAGPCPSSGGFEAYPTPSTTYSLAPLSPTGPYPDPPCPVISPTNGH
ncbi:unnamed protein product, partial [Gulo gulo]